MATRTACSNSLRQVAVFAFFALALTACTKVEEEHFPDHVPERPLMLFSDTTMLDYYEGKVLSWKLKCAYLERWGGEGRVFARPVYVDIFDSVGLKVAFLRADSGELDARMSYVKGYGHVYALTPKGASVRADSLTWNKRTNKVVTESFVRVVSEDGDVLQGKGFESDAKLENWQIHRDVTGIFQDAADRIKNEDEHERSKLGMDSTSSSSVATAKPTPGVSSAKAVSSIAVLRSSASVAVAKPVPVSSSSVGRVQGASAPQASGAAPSSASASKRSGLLGNLRGTP